MNEKNNCSDLNIADRISRYCQRLKKGLKKGQISRPFFRRTDAHVVYHKSVTMNLVRRLQVRIV